MFQGPWPLKKSHSGTPHTGHSRRLLSLENVSVKFGHVTALKEIHFEVGEGEIVFVTGPSGAGKTTLLRVLGGDVHPSEGRIFSLGGRGRDTCFVVPIFQDLRLIGDYTLEANLLASFDPSLYRNRNEFASDMLELAKVLGIYDRLHLKLHKANGGLKQQISFLRAILSRPDVVLADEPTASLDYESAKKIYDILYLYNTKRNLTVVWASHNRDLVKKFSGRIVHLDKGRLIYSGHACFI